MSPSRRPAPIYFTGDRESGLGNPVVVAYGGELQNGTLVIDGFLDIPLDGSIVNRGVLDLSDATIRLAEPENVRSGVVVKCLNGGVITGVPKRGNLPNGWRVRIVNGDLVLVRSRTCIILR